MRAEHSVRTAPRSKRIQAPSPFPDQRVPRLLSTVAAATLLSLVLAETEEPESAASEQAAVVGRGVGDAVGVVVGRGVGVVVGLGVGVAVGRGVGVGVGLGVAVG